MSGPTGICVGCGKRCDYRFYWGYEKPEGLDECAGKLLCGQCRDENDKLSHTQPQTSGGDWFNVVNAFLDDVLNYPLTTLKDPSKPRSVEK